MQFVPFFLPLFLILLPAILAHPAPNKIVPTILIPMPPAGDEDKNGGTPIKNYPLCSDKETTEIWKAYFVICINVSI